MNRKINVRNVCSIMGRLPPRTATRSFSATAGFICPIAVLTYYLFSMATDIITSENLEKLFHVRLTCLLLGEAENCSWWPSSFLSSSGQRFLKSPFPKSANWAAFHSASIAAARHHDSRIGQGGTVHLFRLGHELELLIRSHVIKGGWTPVIAGDTDQISLIKSLKSFSNSELSVSTEGPVRISNSKQFPSESNLKKIAGLYARSFESGSQVLPYGSES